MKNYIVALELVVQSYDEGAGPAAQNTTHSKRRLYASLPCSENEIDGKVSEVAAMAKCNPKKLTLECVIESTPGVSITDSPLDIDTAGNVVISKTGDKK